MQRYHEEQSARSKGAHLSLLEHSLENSPLRKGGIKRFLNKVFGRDGVQSSLKVSVLTGIGP